MPSPSLPDHLAAVAAHEEPRVGDLMRIIPKGLTSVLEIGARDGRVTWRLREHFSEITALDLEKPSFQFPGVTPVAGDVRNLSFPDRSFDVVVCTEVLEHVPGVEKAALELCRVAREAILIGVPYKQDRRIGQMRCGTCGKLTPSWGHVNSFDEDRLRSLFPGWRADTISFVGESKARTSDLAAMLQDLGGNLNGTWTQEEPCIWCNSKLQSPDPSILNRVFTAAGSRLEALHTHNAVPHANWIHVVFRRG